MTAHTEPNRLAVCEVFASVVSQPVPRRALRHTMHRVYRLTFTWEST